MMIARITRLSGAVFLTAGMTLMLAAVAFAQGPGTPSGFGIDGNLLSNSPGSPFNTADDWVPGSNPQSTAVLDNAGNPIDPSSTFHVVDGVGNADQNIFSGSNKVFDNPNTYQWKIGKPTGKDDINHALLHTRSAPNGDLWIIFAGDRLSTNGTSYIDFSLLQGGLQKNPDGTFTAGGPHAGRTIGDLVITLELTNGGTQANFYVQRWDVDPSSSIGYNYFAFTPDPGVAYAAANIDSTVWVPFGAFGDTLYQVNAFAEGAMNITQLLATIDPCIDVPTVFIRTKSSASVNAVLKDFVDPIDFRISTTPDADAGPDKELRCDVPTVTLDGSSATPNTTASWVAFNGGHIVSGANTFTPTVDSPGMYVLTVTNAAECTAQDTALVTEVPPDISCPPDITIDCEDSTDPDVTGRPGLAPPCTGEAEFTYSDSLVDGICEDTIFRTWEFANNASPSRKKVRRIQGNLTTNMGIIGAKGSLVSEASCVQIITITDTTPPELTCPGPVTVECLTDIPAADVGLVQWSDNCGNVTIVHVGDSPPSGECPATITRTYGGTDDCGNYAECSQTITIDDETPPTVTCPGPITVECEGDVPAPDISLVTTSDNCGGTVTVTWVSDSPLSGGGCGGTIIRTYQGADPCGNTAQCTQTITVDDNTPPTITCPGPVTVECTGDIPAVDINSVTASDNCGSVTVTHVSDVSDGLSCPETITRTYRATDACGNTNECTQIITVDDTTAPSITCPGPITVQCEGDVPDPDVNSVTASDNCGSVTVTHVGDSPPSNGVVIRTYRATDDCGNTRDCTQTINIEDTTPPEIVCPGPVTVECIGDVPPPDITSVTVRDNCGGEVTVVHVGDVSDGQTCPETITRTYRATDGAGNSNDCTQTITVDDTTPPSITCPDPITVECSGDVPAANINDVSASDNCGSVTVTHVGDVSDGQSCPETITRTYRATDPCGNTNDCTQTITVDDTTPPTVECPAAITVQCNGDVPAADIDAVTASDNCGSVSVTHVGDVSEQEGCLEIITRTYRAADACGNAAQCTQMITVGDTTRPTITCPGPITVDCEDDVPPPDINSVTVSDNCEGDIAVVHVSDVSDGQSCPKTITRTYRATDACGNTADCTQTITVDDKTPPEITCPEGITVQCEADVPAPTPGEVQASDNCGSVTVTHVSDGVPVNGSFVRTYRATDECGNTNDCTQTITIEDSTPPEITCPGGVTIQCDDPIPLPNPDLVDVRDNCEGAVTVIHVGDVSDNESCPETVTRTYRATDGAGNSSECTQLFTIVDTQAPVCDLRDTSFFLCEPGPVCARLSATDNCDQDPTWNVTSNAGSVEGDMWCYDAVASETLTVSVTCTDECGNECSGSFDVFIVLDAEPECELPNDTTIEHCDPGLVSLPVGVNFGTSGGQTKSAINTKESKGIPLDDVNRGKKLSDRRTSQNSLTTVADGDYCQIVDGPGTLVETQDGYVWEYYAAVDETVTVTIQCTEGDCQKTCEGSFTVIFDINSAPSCSVEPLTPGPAECVPPQYVYRVVTSDPDGDDVTCTLVSGPGELNDNIWQWTPVPGAEETVVIQCADECGSTCESSFTVDVPELQPVNCVVPTQDQEFTLSGPEEITVPISAVGGVEPVVCSVISGPGEIIEGYWTYTPDGSQPYEEFTVGVECSDACGANCQGFFLVKITLNSPPECNLPPLVEFTGCDFVRGIVPLDVTDPDNNLKSCTVLDGPGEIQDGRWEFKAAISGVFDVTIQCEDDFGATCTSTFTVVFDLNNPPECNLHDTTLMVCESRDVSLQLNPSDPDGNFSHCVLQSGPGSVVDNEWIYHLEEDTPVYVTIRCYDDCGDYCQQTIRVNFEYADPVAPLCDLSIPPSVVMCGPGLYCFDIPAACDMDFGQGKVDTKEVCFDVEAEGRYYATIECTGPCGDVCEEEFYVDFSFSTAPGCIPPSVAPRESDGSDAQAVAARPCECPSRGDLNGDGEINAQDLSVMYSFLIEKKALSSASPDCPMANLADVDGNGKLNDSDIEYLKQYLFQSGPAPSTRCAHVSGSDEAK